MRGSITRRGRHSWRVKFDIGTTAGKRATRYITVRGTKAQAQAEAAKIIASTATGQFVDPSKETVTQFVDRWLRDWADQNIGNKTFVRYEQLLRKHVCARVGSIPVQKLHSADLQAIYAAMAREGLADQTRLHVHRVVNRMLGHAQQWGIVAANVAAVVDAPRVRAREIDVLTTTQIQAVLKTLRGRPLYTIVAVLLATGLRRGELLALRWQDVDLDGATLKVEQALEETKRGGLIFKAPKTRHGRRIVTLPPSTVAVLREHWKNQQQQRLSLGLGKAPPDSPVFADWDGSVRSPHWLTQLWRKQMKVAGLKVTLHSLRHSHASTLIGSGLDVLTISRRLGHGSPVITLGVYGHLFKTDDRAAAIMEAALADATVGD
jgi:integrase